MDLDSFTRIRDELDEAAGDTKLLDPIYHRGAIFIQVVVSFREIYVVTSLIDDGYDGDVVYNQNENTPLMVTVRKYRSDLQDIISRTDINSFYYTPLLVNNEYGKSAAELIIRNSHIMSSIDTVWPMWAVLNKIKEECSNDSLLTAKKLLEYNCPFPTVVTLRDATVTKYFLDNGYKVDERLSVHELSSLSGFTALHLAVATSDVKHVKLLLNYGADVRVVNNTNYSTTLDILKVGRDESVEILKMLMEHGISFFDENGNFSKGEILSLGSKRFINELLQSHKLDLNQTCSRGVTLLSYLTGQFYFDPIEEIQHRRLDINTINKVDFETTALMLAVQCCHVRTVEYLLINGAEVNVVCNGYTALYYAFLYRRKVRLQLSCIEILLQYGADALCSHIQGITVFDLVLHNQGFVLIKPVLANLALLQALGLTIEELFLKKIKSTNFYRKYFEFCKHKVEEMRRDKTNRLFEFLTEREEKIFKYARHQELILKLQALAHSTRRSKLYYHKLLRRRVAKVAPIMILRQKAFEFLSRVQGLQNNDIVLVKIVDFFNCDDLKIIAQV